MYITIKQMLILTWATLHKYSIVDVHVVMVPFQDNKTTVRKITRTYKKVNGFNYVFVHMKSQVKFNYGHPSQN